MLKHLLKRNKRKWYENGLSFQCIQCGRCCTGEPGYIWINENEIPSLALALGETRDSFIRTYARNIRGRISLKEMANGDCILLDKNRQCRLYEQRPVQCRTFPFWPENLRTRKDWDRLANDCPGINTGQRHSADEITRISDMVDGHVNPN